MATELATGHRTWSLVRDEGGYRDYKIKHLVRSAVSDGPYAVLLTPGLPLPGSQWAFESDLDPWVWCRQTASVNPLQRDAEGVKFWEVEQLFSNRPDDRKRCSEQQFDDPLLEPDRISGDFRMYAEEATHDRFGDPITTSSHEILRGPQVEFDIPRPSVTIVQNVADLQLPLLGEMAGTVNDAPLWGFPERAIRLTVGPWSKQFYGTCNAYFQRQLLFEIHVKKDPNGVVVSAWDRDLLDEGTKALSGRWATPVECQQGQYVLQNICGAVPDPNDPTHFVRFQDRNGNPCRVVLDGHGLPAETHVVVRENVGVGEPGTGTQFRARLSSSESVVTGIGTVHVEKYEESNFLLLGIPAVLP